MDFILMVFKNSVLCSAVISWFSAQIIKTLLVFITTKKFVPERIFGPGGMPSAHSASVTALSIATCRACGIQSVEFAIAFVLAAVVMYDATSVRRQAGEHAKAINKVVDKVDKMEEDDEELNIRQLKEVLGHTPLEVLAGALLGIIISMIIPVS